MFTENCTLTLNTTDFDSGSVEVLNGTISVGSPCARFKSHSKDKDKCKQNIFNFCKELTLLPI